MIRIGITGARGFIGGHLIDVLKNKKNVKLDYFDLPEGNLLEPSSLRNFVASNDVIVHTAAVNRGSDMDIITGSVIATYNLILAIKKCDSQPKLIFLSSIQAEGNTVYGLSKRLTEIILRDFSQKYKMSVTIFRVTNVFGEGGRPFYNSVIATFCYQIANNEKITISNNKKEINFIYVNNLVKIILEEIFKQRKQLFHFKKIVTKNVITIKELSQLIKSFKNIKNPKKLKLKFHKDLYNTYLSYIK